MQILDYYRMQSLITEPGEFEYLFNALPNEVGHLCEIIHGLFFHFADEAIYGYKIPESRYNEINKRSVSSILAQILKYDNSPLCKSRLVENRVLGVCRDAAALLCSILRHKGVPARLRVGFADYIIPGLYLDGFIVEYWNSELSKWQRVDVRTNAFLIEKLNIKIDFDLHDLPNGKFLTSEMAWQQCREGKINLNRIGSRRFHGMWYVRNCLIKTLLTLIKKEVLVWELWGPMLQNVGDGFEVNPNQLCYFDELSLFIEKNADNPSALQHYYDTHEDLHISNEMVVCNPFSESLNKISIV